MKYSTSQRLSRRFRENFDLDVHQQQGIMPKFRTLTAYRKNSTLKDLLVQTLLPTIEEEGDLNSIGSSLVSMNTPELNQNGCSPNLNLNAPKLNQSVTGPNLNLSGPTSKPVGDPRLNLTPWDLLNSKFTNIVRNTVHSLLDILIFTYLIS